MEQCRLCEGLFLSVDRLLAHVVDHHTRDALRAALGGNGERIVGGNRQHDSWIEALLRQKDGDISEDRNESAILADLDVSSLDQDDQNQTQMLSNYNLPPLDPSNLTPEIKIHVSSPLSHEDDTVSESKMDTSVGLESTIESDTVWKSDRAANVVLPQQAMEQQLDLRLSISPTFSEPTVEVQNEEDTPDKKETNGVNTCEECSVVVEGKMNRLKHIVDQHTHTALYSCALCRKPLASLYTVRRHLRKIHRMQGDVLSQSLTQSAQRNRTDIRHLYNKYFPTSIDDVPPVLNFGKAAKKRRRAAKAALAKSTPPTSNSNSPNSPPLDLGRTKKRTLKEILAGRKPNDITLHRCNLCDRKVAHKSAHIFTAHLDEKKFRFGCVICGGGFGSSLRSVEKHLRSVHSGLDKFTAQMSIVDNLPTLRPFLLELKRKCFGLPKLSNHTRRFCHLCGCAPKGKLTKMNHVLRHHLHEKRYKCSVCAKLFAYFNGIRVHLVRDHSTISAQLTTVEDRMPQLRKKALRTYKLCYPGVGAPRQCDSEQQSRVVDMKAAKTVWEKRRKLDAAYYGPANRCALCPTTELRSKIDHVLQRHSQEKSFSCSACPSQFRAMNTAKKHIGQRHSDLPAASLLDHRPLLFAKMTDKFKVCFPGLPLPSLASETPRSTRIDVDVRQAASRSPYRWPWERFCHICKRTPARVYPVDHVLAYHLQTKRYRCEHCQSCFTRLTLAKYHIAQLHGGATVEITDTLPEHQANVDWAFAKCYPSEESGESVDQKPPNVVNKSEAEETEKESVEHSEAKMALEWQKDSEEQKEKTTADAEKPSVDGENNSKRIECAVCACIVTHRMVFDHVYSHLDTKRFSCSLCHTRFNRMLHAKTHVAIEHRQSNSVGIHNLLRQHRPRIVRLYQQCFPALSDRQPFHQRLPAVITVGVEEARRALDGRRRSHPRGCTLCGVAVRHVERTAHVLSHLGMRLYTCSACKEQFSGVKRANRHLPRCGSRATLIDAAHEHKTEIDRLWPVCFPTDDVQSANLFNDEGETNVIGKREQSSDSDSTMRETGELETPLSIPELALAPFAEEEEDNNQLSPPAEVGQRCSFCGRNFGKSQQRDHVIVHHLAEKPFSCNRCPFKCSTGRSVLRHTQFTHGTSNCDDFSFTCQDDIKALRRKCFK